MAKEKQEIIPKDQYRDMRDFMKSFAVDLEEDADAADTYTAQCKIWGELVNAGVPLPTPGIPAKVSPEDAQRWLKMSKQLKAKLEKQQPGLEIRVFWQDKISARVEFVKRTEEVIPLG